MQGQPLPHTDSDWYASRTYAEWMQEERDRNADTLSRRPLPKAT